MEEADPETAQREIITEAIQRAVDEHEPGGGIVTGFFAVIETNRTNGRPYLLYRTGDINGEGLRSWVALGFLHSAVLAVEEQHFGNARNAYRYNEEDEDQDDDDDNEMNTE